MEKVRIKIDGIEYTPVFNFLVLAKFTEMHNLAIADFRRLQNLTLNQVLDICFLGLQEGCRQKGEKIPFDRDYIGTQDGETLNKLIESISTNMINVNIRSKY